MQTDQHRNRNADQKRKEYRNAAQPRQRSLMQVASLNRRRYPAAAHCEIANAPGKDERQEQRYSEDDQIERGQLNSPWLKDQLNTRTRSLEPTAWVQVRLHSYYSSTIFHEVVWVGRTITTHTPELQFSFFDTLWKTSAGNPKRNWLGPSNSNVYLRQGWRVPFEIVRTHPRQSAAAEITTD